ncbi:MAG: Asp-tRNA(Asn)/Glu-tRNA(Gln) amidotransferase subunit GatC [Halobacteriales archaeon]
MSDQPVDEADVRHVAQLARIDLEEAAVAGYVDQFAAILDWFAALDDVPDVDEPEALTNVVRPDEVRECLEQAEALANAAETDDGYFRGPPVG